MKRIVTGICLVITMFGVLLSGLNMSGNVIRVLAAEGENDGDKPVPVSEIAGMEFPSDSEEIDISNHSVSDMTPDEFCEKLKRFPNLKKVVMCDCGYSNEDMEKLMAIRPDVEFAWMLHFKRWKVRTDARSFSTLQDKDYVITMSNEDAALFRYCTKMQVLDIGHNQITDVSFLQYMPDLHVLIVHQNYDKVNGGKIRDLSYIKYCPKLTYLEIFDSSVSDLSFLQYTPELRDLYASKTLVDDITFLRDLPQLERLYMQATKISTDDYLKLRAIYPEVEFLYYGYTSVQDNNWRNSDKYRALRRSIRNNTLDPLFYTDSEMEEYNRMLEEESKDK